ncbi:hypothetical protein GQ54DRAFT_294986 [Martensiomyces pterosporus]|nr:hypothetical protein GQ54DRAFT_294986 [Martensiomyces pterosporus]
MAQPKKNVAYFYDPDVGNFHYGPGHPMKPHRIRMTHNLVMSYELYKKMSIYRAAPATCQEMTQFHSDDYVDFLNRVTPENASNFQRELGKYNFEEDCPVFDGMFDLFSLSAGSSMEGAARLNRGLSDICINWSGGLHHAKKCEASGFCYINDIVLAILELLRHHQRVLYIDIDVHHGDGVEEAFYTTDRVMTCSFHKYGEFFPGTGDLRDIGEAKGKYYAVNFPLRDGIDDTSYQSVFKPVIQHIMDWYQPNAVVLQCGTDSLAGDKLGCFNLSMDGHAECVRFVKEFNLPTLVLGGGGYTIRNVSRVWAYETGILVGAEMDRKLPMNDYMDYYAPEYTLNVPAYNVGNSNSSEYLERMKTQVLQNIERTRFVPSVQMQDVPRDPDRDNVDEDAMDPDERMPEPMRDQHVVPEAEMYEADAMGLRDDSRDGTKVINEERNNTQDAAEAKGGDVDMDDATTKQSGETKRDGPAPASDAMDVDAVEPETRPKEIVSTPTSVSITTATQARPEASEGALEKTADLAAATTAAATPADKPDTRDKAATPAPSSKDTKDQEMPTTDMSGEPAKVDVAVKIEADDVEMDTAKESSSVSALTVPTASEPSPKTTTTEASAGEVKAEVEPADKDQAAHADTGATPAKDTAPEKSEEPSVAHSATAASPTTSPAATPSKPPPAAAGETPQPPAPALTAPAVATKDKPLPAAPVSKPLLEVQAAEREEGEATEDDEDDEEGEIRDS